MAAHPGGTVKVGDLLDSDLKTEYDNLYLLHNGAAVLLTIFGRHQNPFRVHNIHLLIIRGCTVAPGFDFADFEMADQNGLFEMYPEQRYIIEKYK
jgi:predicted cupin superfamily sugar epimerase